jgi:hypothetical protein
MQVTAIREYRQQLYESFTYRADAQMELIDALLSNTSTQSVVALSLSPCFRRHYSSISDAVDAAFHVSGVARAAAARRQREQQLVRLLRPTLPRPQARRFWLLTHDATAWPRRFARTVRDRGFVYQPNTLRGNTPVTIGHQYEALVLLPEKTAPQAPPWVVPLTLRRITTQETETQVAAEVLNAVLSDPTLPFHRELTVDVADSKHSNVAFLGRVFPNANLVTIVRSRGNRVYYRPYVAPVTAPRGRGAPKHYGDRFALREPTTWGPPDEVLQTAYTSLRGRTYTVDIQAWENLIMPGKRDCPMWDKPFTLVRIRLLDSHGHAVFRRTLWLLVMGPRRGELTLRDIWLAYRQRYDVEHFFRFAKQRLLLAHFGTPDTEHEETWAQMVQLAYTQLWLMHDLVTVLPRPWEQYLPRVTNAPATPSQTQRDALRILRHIGTPAQPPKTRGKSPGRLLGTRIPPRPRLKVVKKTKKRAKTRQNT